MNINEVTYTEIKQLSDVDLSKLLLQLLNAEAAKLRFTATTQIVVPLRINIGDAGEDGRITCVSTNGSMYIPNPRSIFQNKATDLSPSALYNEFFSVNTPSIPAKGKKTGQPRQLVLKTQIKEVLDEGGQYIFFIGHDYNASLAATRLTAAQNALTDYNALHHKTYQPSQVKLLEANEIANWTNNHIAAVVFVQNCNGIFRPSGLQTVDELESYEEFSKVPFQTNDILDSFISQIKANLQVDKSSLRIVGHSGLGKTRLVYEAFKSSEMTNQAVYYNIVKDPDAIIHFVRSYGRRLDGILVVDNCDYGAHKLLKDEIERTDSKFKLITIDYNVSEENEVSKTRVENYIFLSSRYYTEIVKEILKQQFAGRLSPSNIDQIAAFSEGYPSMAVLFANARLDGFENLPETLGDDLIERLAFGRDYANKDTNKFDILIACSIFSRFGRPSTRPRPTLNEQERNHYKGQLNLIIERICEPAKSTHQFLESTDYFEDRKVMERRGYNLTVKPTPLALKLAMKWWQYVDKDALLQLFPLLEQNQLALPLVERLAELDQLREAQQVVNDLWGSNSPFGTAEVLNTSLGSQLFRSVAQVNPETAITTLEAVFGRMSLIELEESVGPGRRYIIWTLEMLAFRRVTFSRAVTLLFRFAAAENEQISNNATGQVVHLFQIFLAGTEANLVTRLNSIDEHLSSPDEKIRHLAIQAMIRGLNGHHFTRTIGAEKIGSSAPLIDFIPTWAESATYWSELITRLTNVARDYPEERQSVKSGIARAFRNLFNQNLSHLVKAAVIAIHDFDPSYWEDAINQLKASRKYETVNEEENTLISELLLHLQPQTLEDQIKSIVSFPEWTSDKSPEGVYVDHGANNAAEFAEKLIAERADLDSVISYVLQGEQRKAFAFGYKFGELLQDIGFAHDILRKLKTIPANKHNPEFAAAYIAALPYEERKTIIDEMILDDQLVQSVVYFTKVQPFTLQDIIKLLDVVATGRIDINQFYQLSFGNGFRQFTEEEFITMVEYINSIEEGPAVALELIGIYIHDNKDRWDKFKALIRSIIISNNLLIKEHRGNLNFLWYELTEKLLSVSIDQELATALTLQILEASINDRLGSFESSLKTVVEKLMKMDFELFWSIIGPAILDNSTYLNFKFFLGTNNGAYGGSGLMEYADYDGLVEWCDKNSPLAPKRIAYMMPITLRDDKRRWHPLAIKMIDKFGELDGFMNELSANVHSFGSVGSVVPYLKNQQALFAALLDHSLPAVRSWALKEVKNYDINIERAGLEEDSEYW